MKTTITYRLPQAANVNLSVYNVRGSVIAILANERKSEGVHKIIWDGSNVKSDVYFIRLAAGSFGAIKKIILIK